MVIRTFDFYLVFYLNIVGYKGLKRATDVAQTNEFYLNIVGYKGRALLWTIGRRIVFYLNIVGYKGRQREERKQQETSVLSEHSGI